jgi:NADH-quinone oxidoreductase subunit J
MDALAFYLSGLLSLALAVLVVTRKNPVYSTIFLVIFFALISLDFLILRAPFLAVVQVLIYAGAIMVLFLFVIMLLNLTPEELREEISPARKRTAGALSLIFFTLLATAIHRSPTVGSAGSLVGPVTGDVAQAGEAFALGAALFSAHALAFEFSSVLILVAIVGAIYLSKKRKTRAPKGERAEPAREPSQAILSPTASISGSPTVEEPAT